MLATLRAELGEIKGPAKDGRLLIEVKFSPMASTAFDSVRCCCLRRGVAGHCLRVMLLALLVAGMFYADVLTTLHPPHVSTFMKACTRPAACLCNSVFSFTKVTQQDQRFM